MALDTTLTVRDSWDREGETLRRTAAWSGVETCGSCWSCPVCSVRVRSDRARAIGMLDRWARSEGWSVTMLTLTIRHGMGDDLRHMTRRMSKAWQGLQTLTSWRTLLSEGAYFVRALEMTYGRSGWHPHYHVLVLSPNELPREWNARAALVDDITHGWMRLVSRHVGAQYEPDETHGVDWREVDAGEYISKLDLSMGMELTDAAGAKSSSGGRKPSELLRDARAHESEARAARARGEHELGRLHELGAQHDVERYRDYERAMSGQRLHTASAGLLKWWQAEADAEREDEMILVDAYTVPGELWDLLRHLPDALPDMAEQAEQPDPAGAVAAWLRSLGTRAIQTRAERTSLSGWTVRDDTTRTLDGHRWSSEWRRVSAPDGYRD